MKIEACEGAEARLVRAETEARLLSALAAENTQTVNRLLVYGARDDAGLIRGGATGTTSYGWLNIKVLWVDGPRRGTGLGKALLLQIEAAAIELGCHGSWLDTSSLGAHGFYASQGYKAFGRLQNKANQAPEGHRRMFLKKML